MLVGVNKLGVVAVLGMVSLMRENNRLLFRFSLVEEPNDQLVMFISALRGGVSGVVALMVIL